MINKKGLKDSQLVVALIMCDSSCFCCWCYDSMFVAVRMNIYHSNNHKKKSGRRRVMKEKKRGWSELVKIEQRNKNIKLNEQKEHNIVWWFPFDVMVL